MRNSDELFFFHDVDEHSKLLNTYYGDLTIVSGFRIIAISRDGQTIYPAMDTQFQAGDRILVFTTEKSNKGITKVFGRNAMAEN